MNALHAASVSILEGDDPFLQRIHRVIDALKEELGEYLQVRIVLRGEREMTSLGYCLYDDRVKLDGTLSEFVCGFFKTVLRKYKCSDC
mgnify:FL=1